VENQYTRAKVSFYMAQRETHPYNKFKPGCEKRFTPFYGFVAKSGLKTKDFISNFLQRWGTYFVGKQSRRK
jgi:hypothetical protein